MKNLNDYGKIIRTIILLGTYLSIYEDIKYGFGTGRAQCDCDWTLMTVDFMPYA